MKKVLACLLLLCMLLTACSQGAPGKTGGTGSTGSTGSTGETETTPAPTMEELDFSSVDISKCTDTEEVTEYVRIEVSYTDSKGNSQIEDIVVRLYSEVAPITVANFQRLVQEDFYDGLTFHRVYPGFMIQGGDPNGNGSGGSEKIFGEMTNNGFTNNLEHKRGVLSMARQGGDYNSGSCQFFIMHVDYPSLNNEYASFGYVVYGMETVDGITGTDRYYSSSDQNYTRPVNPVTIRTMTFVTVAE